MTNFETIAGPITVIASQTWRITIADGPQYIDRSRRMQVVSAKIIRRAELLDGVPFEWKQEVRLTARQVLKSGALGSVRSDVWTYRIPPELVDLLTDLKALIPPSPLLEVTTQ